MAGGSGDAKGGGAGQGGGTGQESGAKPSSGLARWAQISLLLLVLIFLGFGIWLLVNSQAIVGSANDRNFHNLEVAANGLETWPRDVQTLAANNYNEARWQDVKGEAPSGSFKMVSFSHPQLGRFRIYYLPADQCDPAPASAAGKTAANDDFRVFDLGRFPGQGPVFQIRQAFRAGKDMPRVDADGRLCFQVGISLDRLIALDRAAPNFSNLLILAADGSVVQQVGKTALPVSKIEKFTPGDTLTKGVIQQLTTGKPQDKPAESAAIPLDAVQQAVDITIADVAYVAYVRPFVLKDQPAACAVAPKSDGTRFDGSKCYAVALMPKASLRHAWLSPPSTMLASFGLLLLIILALLPLVRLLLIGGAETAGPLEMAGIVLGLQTAAAVATLAVLFAADATAQRTAAQNESVRLAETLSASANTELKGAIAEIWGIATSSRNAWTDYCQPPNRCTSSAGPQGVVTWEPRKGYPSHYLPPLWSVTYVAGPDPDKRGQPVDGTFTLAATEQMTPRINVRWRDYFIAYLDGRARPLPDLPDDGTIRAVPVRYTLGQVRSQTDGVNKTILTIGPVAPPDRLRFPDYKAPITTRDGALVAPLVLRSFLSPILPMPHRFMVVDTSQASLPVLFHSEPDRACIDQLGEQVDIDGPTRQALRFPKSERGRITPVTFMARYDGVLTQFNAVRIPDTDWAVVTFYALDDVDKIAGRRVATTLTGWGGLAMVGMLLFAIWLWLGRGSWRALWPHQKAAPEYRRMSIILLAAGAAVTAIMPLVAPLYGVAGAALLWTATIFLVGALALIRPEAEPITPETERAYRLLVIAMLVCCSVAPMTAIWRDAGVLVSARVDGDRLTQAKTAAADRQFEALAIQRSYREDSKPMPLFGAPLSAPGLITGKTVVEDVPRSFSTYFWTMNTGFSPGPLPHCRTASPDWSWGCWFRTEKRSSPGKPGVILTTFGVKPHAGALPGNGSPWDSGFLLFAGGIGLLALACLSLVVLAVHFCLNAATGFGVPLGAVNWPRLAMTREEAAGHEGAGAVQVLGRKSLLVAPQQAVRERLLTAEVKVVDFADPAWTLADPETKKTKVPPSFEDEKEKVKRIVFMGLELVLRDAERRRIALKILEDANRDVETRMDNQLIIIAEMSPLERILDAFEFEYVDDDGKDRMREELRWARLFHDFTTFSFAPIDKVDETALQATLAALKRTTRLDRLSAFIAGYFDKRAEAAGEPAPAEPPSAETAPPATTPAQTAPADIRSTSEVAAIGALVRDLRWLPGRVIDGIIGNEDSRTISETYSGPYPVPPEKYRAYYTGRIIDWAKAIQPPSEAAAIDFMRSNIIEHYEQCWVSSTFAERFVLEALARGRFVNMTRALALQSLVRRGLVVLDPAPRLMNRSFALFVRQTERPNRLQQWKDKQPRSTWSSARLPLLIVLPVIVIAIAAAVAETGQSLPAVFSLLAAGAPALLAALINSFARKS